MDDTLRILIAGAGKIGTTIGYMLANQSQYQVYLADNNVKHSFAQTLVKRPSQLQLISLNIDQEFRIRDFIRDNQIDAIVSCLPYFLTVTLAKAALTCGVHYFDLTEDVALTEQITQMGQNSKKVMLSQCGIAPGFINIVTADLIKRFDTVETVKLRCGALPQTSSHPLQYSLTWSVDGLINEYLNPCPALQDGKIMWKEALEDLESLQIDGNIYETFNTSGGVGTLFQTFAKQVRALDYQSIRYPGHCEKMKLLLHGLKLSEDIPTLRKILLKAIPYTHDDVVIVYVSAHGMQKGILTRETYVKKFYPLDFFQQRWTAIQAVTASSTCAVIDIVLNQPEKYQGRIRQEDFLLNEILTNRFGQYFNLASATGRN